MQKYKLTIEFDGTHFCGWQIQPTDVTVEQTLEEAFAQILQQPVELVGQGRTDSGVHARGQIAHVEFPDEMEIEKLIFGVNGLVGDQIQIVQVEKVEADFHARFDAIAREYEYTIATRCMPLHRHYAWSLRYPVDVSVLHACAAELKGEIDFAGYSKFNQDNFTTLCDIQKSVFYEDGETIRYQIKANRFLRNMVRRLVGSMVRVAQGKLTYAEFMEALQNPESKIPTYTAPAHGLVLQKVFY